MQLKANKGRRFGQWMLITLLMAGTSNVVFAGKEITLIQVSDLHGNLLPHAGIIEEYDPATGGVSERAVTNSGGIAKVATIIKDIRATSNHSLTLGVGDTLHGSAEVLFTMGDAIMPALNKLGLDAYTPGNWEFAYGPAVFRHRFVDLCKANPNWQFPGPTGNPGPGVSAQCPVIPANARIMTDADGQDGVVAANFPTLANNIYNGGPFPLGAGFYGKRPLKPYMVFERDGVKIGVIGITSAIVPQQPPVFSRTLSFSQGTEELPGDIAAAKAEGAEIIVILSELALPQNVQIGREFPEVDVILSAHSHELTVGAILADGAGYEMVAPGAELTGTQLSRLQKGAAVIVEAGEDLYVGRLDLKIADKKIQNFVWEAIPADDGVPEDAEVAQAVADQEKYFVAGDDFKTHSYLPFVYCLPYAAGKFDPVERCGGDVVTREVKRGVRLVDALDQKVAETEILLHRHDSLEGAMNNVIADAFLDTLESVARGSRSQWADLDIISMTNGFRFDTVILPPNASLPADIAPTPAGSSYRDGRTQGDVTLRDLWGYFPTAAALVAADYAGVAVEESMNGILANVFSPNPYIQRGGWYVGISKNMSQVVDVVRLPRSTSGSRIIESKVNGQLLDPSKRYVIASCYGHTFAIGRSCRTEGGANMVFFELQNGDDYTSTINPVEPLATTGLIDNRPGRGGVGARAAPDNFVHPIHSLRQYLAKVGVITDVEYGHDAGHRVKHVNSLLIQAGKYVEEELPTSGLPGIVQPVEGIGPGFLKRLVGELPK